MYITGSLGLGILRQTKCVCETQIPNGMKIGNSKDGQDEHDKYHETSTRKILSQEMLTCNMKALMTNVNSV